MNRYIITGANGQLGQPVTSHLLSLSYKLLAAVSPGSESQLTSQENLSVHPVDLANESAAREFVLEAAKTPVHGAILLAGGFAMGDLANTSSKQIREQITLNFETAYHIVQPLMAHLAGQGTGHIILVGSRPALNPSEATNKLAYSLSKAMLFQLAEIINAGDQPVRASVIVPSTIDTPANRSSMPNADPSKWVKPGAIAKLIALLLSDTATPLRKTVLKIYGDS